jgi:predicted RNA-binding protein with PUA domain
VEEEHSQPEWWCRDCDRQFMNENCLNQVSMNSDISLQPSGFRLLASLKLKDERTKAN